MIVRVLRTALLAFAWGAAGSASAASVSPNGGLTDLGLFAAGAYEITGSGLVDLVGDTHLLRMAIRPDGVPNTPVLEAAYLSFNEDDIDGPGSFTADGNLGPAGSNARIGTLIGTLNAAGFSGGDPFLTPAADWFLIGFSTTIVLAGPTHIYAAVNDTYYPNNVGSFDAVVAPVPEPAAFALLLAGILGLSAVAVGRKQR
jgi:hypothetical protein